MLSPDSCRGDSFHTCLKGKITCRKFSAQITCRKGEITCQSRDLIKKTIAKMMKGYIIANAMQRGICSRRRMVNNNVSGGSLERSDFQMERCQHRVCVK